MARRSYAPSFVIEFLFSPVSEPDADDINDLMLVLHRENTGNFVPITTDYIDWVANEQRVLVARVTESQSKWHGRIVGMATLNSFPQLGAYRGNDEIQAIENDIAVIPALQGYGIGDALKVRLGEIAKEIGASSIFLTSHENRGVKPDNLYRKHGFVRKDTRIYVKNLV